MHILRFNKLYWGLYRLIVTIVAVSIGAIQFGDPVYAQEFSVRPSKLEVEAYRGRSATIDLQIIPQTLDSILIDVEILSNNFYEEGEVDVENWFDFTRRVSVDGEEIDYVLEISPPFTAAGDYEFELIFARSSQGLDDMIRLGYRIPFNLRVLGTRLAARAKLDSFEVSDIVLGGKDRSMMKMKIQNIGNLKTPVTGSTQLSLRSGKSFRPIGSYNFEFQKTMPNQLVSGRIILDRVLPNSDLRAKTRVKYDNGAERVVETIISRQSESADSSDPNNVAFRIALAKPVIELNLLPGASRFFSNKINNLSNATLPLGLALGADSRFTKLRSTQVSIGPYMNSSVIGQVTMPPEDFKLRVETVELIVPGLEVMRLPIIIKNPEKKLVKSISIGSPILKKEKLDNTLTWEIVNTGEDYIRPDLQVTIRDELLATAHRLTENENPKILPTESFDYSYDIINRITQRPGKYSVTFSSKCCTVRAVPFEFEVTQDASIVMLDEELNN